MLSLSKLYEKSSQTIWSSVPFSSHHSGGEFLLLARLLDSWVAPSPVGVKEVFEGGENRDHGDMKSPSREVLQIDLKESTAKFCVII